MKKVITPFLAILLICGLNSCKPTEKNYQAAYDAAQKKRQEAKASDADLAIPAKGFHEYGERPRQEINGYVVETTTDFLSLIKGDEDALKRWNVAVGCYKMKTNAISQMNGLEKDGYKPYVGEARGNKFYVFAGGFPTVEEAAKFASEYASKKDSASFVGLNGAPLLIEKRW